MKRVIKIPAPWWPKNLDADEQRYLLSELEKAAAGLYEDIFREEYGLTPTPRGAPRPVGILGSR